MVSSGLGSELEGLADAGLQMLVLSRAHEGPADGLDRSRATAGPRLRGGLGEEHQHHLRAALRLHQVHRADAIDIKNVWHSGHRPGKEHDGPYQELYG